MGSVDNQLAKDLQERLDLRRAVETGTYQGGTTRQLAELFARVVTIEVSEELHAKATDALSDLPNVVALHGHSVARLEEVADQDGPTLYFLDGHWSGDATGGADDECPVLEELKAIGAGHQNDCFIVDDARLFTSTPAPPHKPEHWPELIEVFDALRAQRPEHVVTLLADQVVAVPRAAKPALDAYGLRIQQTTAGGTLVSGAVRRLVGRVR